LLSGKRLPGITDTVAATYSTSEHFEYAYNAANQLVTAHSSDDGITWHYTHDQRGNLLRQTPGGTEPAEGETRCTYNSASQLVRVELYTAAGYVTLAEGVYNAYGQRVQLTTWAGGVPQTVAYGVYQGQLLVADDGTQATLHLYGWNLIAEFGAEGWGYHLRDGMGSLRQVADESGMVTLSRAYKPFGGILQQQGLYETAFGFLGAELDRISGLMYANGQYYDPSIHREL
jgi:YD repeat-containing protein